MKTKPPSFKPAETRFPNSKLAKILFVAGIVGATAFFASTKAREDVALPEGNRFDVGEIELNAPIQHEFAVMNVSVRPIELNSSTTNCCSVTTVTPLKLTLLPNQKGALSIHTRAVGAGKRSEGIEIFTTTAGKSESIWLFINYSVRDHQRADALH